MEDGYEEPSMVVRPMESARKNQAAQPSARMKSHTKIVPPSIGNNHIPLNQGSRYGILTVLTENGIDMKDMEANLDLNANESSRIQPTDKDEHPVMGFHDLGQQIRKY